MKKELSENQVLKKLKIQDFQQMSKEKVIEFASMLPRMDPEVSKKALEQFPEFAKLTSGIMTEFQKVSVKAFESNDNSMEAYNSVCQTIIESLEKMLESDQITFEEKKYIIDKTIEVAKMMGEKDSENKKFLMNALKVVGGIAAGLGLVALAAVGQGLLTSKDEGDPDGGCDNDAIDIDYYEDE